MKARYYDGQTARFTSMDPYVFRDLRTIIHDPQLMNTYGYARNNPIMYHDPNGELAQGIVRGGILVARQVVLAASIGAIFETTKQIGDQLFGDGGRPTGEFLSDTANTAATEGALSVFEPFHAMAEATAAVGEGYTNSDASSEFGKIVDGATQGAPIMMTEVIGSRMRGVSGPDVSTFSRNFFDGAHTYRAATLEMIEQGITNILEQSIDVIKTEYNRAKNESREEKSN